jgi:hypothetical protein
MRNYVRGALAVLTLAVLIGTPLQAEAAPPRSSAETYDVADLLRKPGRTGYARIEDIIEAIVTSVDPESWDKTGDSTLEEVNGSRLVIITDAAHHAEIKELLAAARRRIDLRVDFKSELYEIERKVYEKEFKDKLKDGKAAVVEEKVVEELHTRGSRLKDATAHAGDSETATIFSLRRAFTYIRKPAAPPTPAVRGSGLTGLRVSATVSVTADRRFVRLKCANRTTELVAIKKRTVTNPDDGSEVETEVPDLTESSATFNITIGDGGPILVPVTLADGNDRERVRLLLVRPTIYIEEEEKERRKKAP